MDVLSSVQFDILISTYNGDKYIKQQLDSLLLQLDYIKKIYIRDDGSTDKTISIINEYIIRYPNLFVLVEDNKGNLGPRDSFFTLCEYVTSSFIAFCDQDDVWNPKKLGEFSNYIATKKINGESEKALIHCDLEVVDAKLQRISPSFWKLMGIDHEDTILDVSIRNTVTGCACVISKALMSEYKGKAYGFKMHDHFYAAHAAINNSVYRIHLPLIKYRQHSNNCVGAGLNPPNKSLFKKIATKKITDYPRLIISRCTYDWDKLCEIINALSCSVENNPALTDLIKLQKVCHRQPLVKMIVLLWMFLFEKSITANGFKRLFLRPLKINKK
ncbi:glycosyltransferase [Aeromonas veronii]|uniref:glycosyltransferase n=1 Tax=Aeromonas veronii TaxID=654 RepID=UPI00300670FE